MRGGDARDAREWLPECGTMCGPTGGNGRSHACGSSCGSVVEVRDADEADAAMAARAAWKKPDGSLLVNRLLLDNHTPDQAAAMVERWGGTIPLEASGGITPDNARAYAEAGVDFVSMGWITHSVKGMDFSLKSATFFNG